MNTNLQHNQMWKIEVVIYHSSGGVASDKQINHNIIYYLLRKRLFIFTFESITIKYFIVDLLQLFTLVSQVFQVKIELHYICLKKFVTRHNKGCISSMFAKLRAKLSFLSLSHFGTGRSFHPIEFLYVTRFTTTRCSDQYVFIACAVRSYFESCFIVYFFN